MKAVKLPEHDFIYKYIQPFYYTSYVQDFFRFLWTIALNYCMSNLASLLRSFGASVAFKPTHRQ